MSEITAYSNAPLPAGIRSRFIADINGLNMHLLEAGFATPNRPCILLLHGFPELAYSWRKIMPALAAAGYHVIAPDQRGYGLTTGWDNSYEGDIRPFSLLSIVRDALALVLRLGYQQVAAVIGHDFGSPVAAYCALTRPDVFRSVALMSAPFGGPPSLSHKPAKTDIHAELAALDRPRKHYQWYYSGPEANADMHNCPQGLHDFLRAYYHHKSADWALNQPFPLAGWQAEALAQMPSYYIMDYANNMAATVAPEMPSASAIKQCQWLPDNELAVYSQAFERTGFQGGLNWYRCATDEHYRAELQLFSGRSIDVPSCFIAGQQDWGVYQKPGDFEAMQTQACSQMRGCHRLDGAGHWVQQEQAEQVSRLLLEFLQTL